MASSAIKTPAFQAKAGNIQNEDGSSIYSNGDWSLKNSTALTSVTITDAGRVGVLATSPRGVLDLNTTREAKIYLGTAGVIGETQSNAGDYIANNLFVSAETAGTMTYTKTTGDSGNAIVQDFSRGITFYSGVTGAASSTGTLNNFERMRIDASGNLLVGGGLTSPLGISRLSITYADFSSGNQARPGIEIGTTANKVTYLRNETDSNGVPGAFLRTGGDIDLGVVVVASTNGVRLAKNGTSWGSYSDERLKDITGEIDNALDKVTKIRAVKYAWKNDEQKVQRVGVIAQDVQKVLPEVVDTDTDYLQVRYSEIVPLCLKAIQELSAKNEALEARLAALEAK